MTSRRDRDVREAPGGLLAIPQKEAHLIPNSTWLRVTGTRDKGTLLPGRPGPLLEKGTRPCTSWRFPWDASRGACRELGRGSTAGSDGGGVALGGRDFGIPRGLGRRLAVAAAAGPCPLWRGLPNGPAAELRGAASEGSFGAPADGGAANEGVPGLKRSAGVRWECSRARQADRPKALPSHTAGECPVQKT